MPSARSRAASASPAVLAVLVLVAVALVVLALTLVRGAGGGTEEGSGSATGGTAAAASSAAATPDSGLPGIAESALPDEADTTLALIRAGGPFPHEEDGSRFGNRERILPRRASGYYREYTVETPGDGDRGPRRLVVGADGDLYWTTDHYASFRQVQEGR